jgi:hypothetical protein
VIVDNVDDEDGRAVRANLDDEPQIWAQFRGLSRLNVVFVAPGGAPSRVVVVAGWGTTGSSAAVLATPPVTPNLNI